MLQIIDMTESPLSPSVAAPAYPARILVEPAVEDRNRLTTGFRLILAIPHLLLVGGPIAAGLSWMWQSDGDFGFGAGGGVLGAAAGVVALIAWFAILFTGRYPEGLRSLAIYYLHWRVRAVAYTALLRDEYPPFGEGLYPATLDIDPAAEPRNRLTVAFRLILVFPHLIVVWALGIAWGFTTLIAWFAILFAGSYPPGLYDFGVGVLRWNTRVEGYILLLYDEYPPFSLE